MKDIIDNNFDMLNISDKEINDAILETKQVAAQCNITDDELIGTLYYIKYILKGK